eukprot:1153004-Pelagomonas_calceolata.AAC.4
MMSIFDFNGTSGREQNCTKCFGRGGAREAQENFLKSNPKTSPVTSPCSLYWESEDTRTHASGEKAEGIVQEALG